MTTSHPLLHEDPAGFGEYRLVARLGSGGMGTVYLGRSRRGRTVAVKTMHAEFAERTDFRSRFRLEVDAARVIGGRYGAQVIDADPLADTPWLATEFVLGPQLDDAVALCGPFPEEATRALGVSLCEALGMLHDSGVVHRDLKPSNVLLTATGPKVIDFGIARAPGDDRLTRTGAAAGTPAFMSPEQASDTEHTPAGDVFALAGVLVFTCTGHGPFGSGQAADLLYRVRYGQPDLSGVPDALVPVLERCLTKNAEERPGTSALAAELREGCGEFVDCLPDAVHTEILRRATDVWQPPPPRLPAADADTLAETDGARGEWSRRRVLALSGGGALAATGAGLLAWRLWPEQSPPDGQKTVGPAGGPPDAVWKNKLPDGLDSPSPYVVGRYVHVMTEGGLEIFDAKSGRRTGGNHEITSNADYLSGDGHCHAADTENDALSEVDPKTGNFLAPVPHPHSFGISPVQLLAETNGAILVQGKHKEKGKKREQRIAIDAQSGKLRWRRTLSRSGSAVVKCVGDVLVTLDDPHVEGVSLRTGRKLWEQKLPHHSGTVHPSAGDSVQSDTHVYFARGLRELIAVRVSDGAIDWRFGADRKFPKDLDRGGNRYSPPAVKDGVLYTLELGNGVVALDATSGRLKWEAKVAWADDDMLYPPVVGERYVYFPTHGSRWVTTVDLKRRKEAWTYQGPVEMNNAILLAHRAARRLIVCNSGTALALPLE